MNFKLQEHHSKMPLKFLTLPNTSQELLQVQLEIEKFQETAVFQNPTKDL